MYDISEIRKGTKIEINGEPFLVVESQFVKPGKGSAFVRARIKSLTSGLSIEKTWKQNERIDRASLEERGMEFLYRSGDEFHFMDTANYEQMVLSEDQVGDAANWLTENLPCSVLFHNGRAISVDVPNFVELDIVQCEPAVKGDTKTNASKQAVLSTGAKVQVPMFVDNNERIRIDTRTGEYVERVKR